MQVSSWATILLSMSLEATSLLGVMASISSMKRIHGAELCKTRREVTFSLYCYSHAIGLMLIHVCNCNHIQRGLSLSLNL